MKLRFHLIWALIQSVIHLHGNMSTKLWISFEFPYRSFLKERTEDSFPNKIFSVISNILCTCVYFVEFSKNLEQVTVALTKRFWRPADIEWQIEFRSEAQGGGFVLSTTERLRIEHNEAASYWAQQCGFVLSTTEPLRSEHNGAASYWAQRGGIVLSTTGLLRIKHDWAASY